MTQAGWPQAFIYFFFYILFCLSYNPGQNNSDIMIGRISDFFFVPPNSGWLVSAFVFILAFVCVCVR